VTTIILRAETPADRDQLEPLSVREGVVDYAPAFAAL